jgi:hypothetical protein
VAYAHIGAAVTLTPSINPEWKQTSAGTTEAQLSAAPEYFNQGAYVKLFGASYPQSLPYSTGLDGLRTYLQQWKLPLWQLRQALLPLSGGTVDQQAAVAAERFGIPPHGEDLIVSPNLVTDEIAWNTANPLTDLAPVPAFLQAANLTYESLLELLQVAWVQDGTNVEIQGIDDTCMTNKQVLKPLNANWLNTTTPGGAGHVTISPDASETIGQPAYQTQFLAIQLFDKVAVLVRGLRLVATDLTWLLTNSAVYGGFDFARLPVATGQPALNLSSLLTTFLVIKLARSWTAAPPASSVQTLYDVIDGISGGNFVGAPQAQSALQTITGWPLADIEAFAAALGLVFPSMYQQPAAYDALRALEVMASAVTASGADVATPSTTLVSGIGAMDTSITVASDIGFPSPTFYVYIGSEILHVTAAPQKHPIMQRYCEISRLA